MTLTRRGFVLGSALAGALCSFKSEGDADSSAERPAGKARCADVLPFNAGDAANSPFDQYSTAEGVTRGLDLSGKTVLITGSNSGIGLETLRVLVLRGAHGLAFARSIDKARQACADVVTAGAQGKATPIACEQTDYASVVAAAKAVRDLGMPIDMLICNAGLNVPTLEQVNGVEKHFAVQHLSHFILVNRLLDRVRAALQGRIVMVSSILYRAAPESGIEFDNLSGERGQYDMYKAYGQSKLANGLFARELARLLCGTAATANVLHPGLIPTNIGHTLTNLDPQTEARLEADAHKALSVIGPGRESFVKTIAQGAATSCYVATNPALARVSGAYFEDCRIVAPGGHMEDEAMAGRLWKVSEDLTRQYLNL